MIQANEEQIIQQYEPMLQRIVKNFRRRCSHPTTSEADLLQEARIAFLEHIRTHEEQDYSRCYRTIIHALFETVRRDYPVYVPYGAFRKHDYNKITLIDCDAVEVPSASNELEKIEVTSMFLGFIDELTQEERQLIKLKMNGMTSREAGRRIGMSDVQVHRLLTQIRRRTKNEAWSFISQDY